MPRHGITRVINLSETCPPPNALSDDAHHFLRIPIKDSYCAKLLPHFDAAFKFIEEPRKTGGQSACPLFGGNFALANVGNCLCDARKTIFSDEAAARVFRARRSSGGGGGGVAVNGGVGIMKGGDAAVHAKEAVPSPSTEFSRLGIGISLSNPCFGINPPQQQAVLPPSALAKKVERNAKTGTADDARATQTCENPMFGLMNTNGQMGKRRWRQNVQRSNIKKIGFFYPKTASAGGGCSTDNSLANSLDSSTTTRRLEKGGRCLQMNFQPVNVLDAHWLYQFLAHDVGIEGESARSDNIKEAAAQSDNIKEAAAQSDKIKEAAAQSDNIKEAAAQSDKIKEAAAQSDNIKEAAAQSDNIKEAAAQSDNIKEAAAQSDKIKEAAAQSDNIKEAAAQSDNIKEAAAQSDNIKEAAAQSDKIKEAAAQSDNIKEAAAQSDKIKEAAAQSDNIKEAAAQSDNIKEAAAQSDNIKEAAAQSDNIKEAAAQSDNIKEAAAQSDNIKEAAAQSDNIKEAAAQSDNIKGAAAQSDNIKEAAAQSDNIKEAAAQSDNIKEAAAQSDNIKEAAAQSDNIKEADDDMDSMWKIRKGGRCLQMNFQPVNVLDARWLYDLFLAHVCLETGLSPAVHLAKVCSGVHLVTEAQRFDEGLNLDFWIKIQQPRWIWIQKNPSEAPLDLDP
uniref:Uncharacterized protein n=1 Tax=Globodera rostochiensis TaxID=31243 RepID=A0A914HV59_GLORO